MGRSGDLCPHLETCRYEALKHFVSRTDQRLNELQTSLGQRDQEVGFLRSMLGTLSERVDQLETRLDGKLGMCELNHIILFFFV